MDQYSFNQYLGPFNDITQLMIAVFIIVRLQSELSNNRHENILNAINAINKTNLNGNQLKKFIHNVSSYPHLYPIEFIKKFENLKNELKNKTTDKNEPNLVLLTESSYCHNCQFNEPNWFIVNNPKICKVATLYSVNGIG